MAPKKRKSYPTDKTTERDNTTEGGFVMRRQCITTLEDAFGLTLGLLNRVKAYLKNPHLKELKTSLDFQVPVLMELLVFNRKVFGVSSLEKLAATPSKIKFIDIPENDAQPSYSRSMVKENSTSKSKTAKEGTLHNNSIPPLKGKQYNSNNQAKSKAQQTSENQHSTFSKAVTTPSKIQGKGKVAKNLASKKQFAQQNLRRSGRVHIKPLKYWAGERLVVNDDGTYRIESRRKSYLPEETFTLCTKRQSNTRKMNESRRLKAGKLKDADDQNGSSGSNVKTTKRGIKRKTVEASTSIDRKLEDGSNVGSTTKNDFVQDGSNGGSTTNLTVKKRRTLYSPELWVNFEMD